MIKRRWMQPAIVVCACSMLLAAAATAQPLRKSTKYSPQLARLLETVPAGKSLTAWVFFTDKGPAVTQKISAIRNSLTARNYRRRLRNHTPANVVDAYDVPVDADYINRVGRVVDRVKHRSRWLNAVSVLATSEQLRRIAQWDFVSRLDVVHRRVLRAPQPASKHSAPAEFSGTQALNYGASLTQNQQIKVTELHNMGFDGTGVLIAMLDAGFNNLEHEAFSQLDIVATWDFANNDSDVDDDPAQLGNGSHGTWTLSVIGGFKEGQLIGPAYGASFLLAKTEITNFESHIEEDNWVAAAEWADSLGADIISSSLGYRDGFVSGEANYTSADMDGQTTIVTIGAEVAASRGILVVNSAGNEGSALPGENTLVAPADGEHVLCVGAVDALNNRASFSSVGPTADGRIKPDVMAMGQGVVTASASFPDKYGSLDGTSFSCPLAAGAAALLLQAVPRLTNAEILDLLRDTASNADTPDNEFGWGIIDLLAAYNRALVTGVDAQQTPIESFTLYPAFPNPFNPSTVIQYDLPANLSVSERVQLKIFNVLGQEITTLVDGLQTAGRHRVVWNGTDQRGATVPTGLYIYRVSAGHRTQSGKVLFLK